MVIQVCWCGRVGGWCVAVVLCGAAWYCEGAVGIVRLLVRWDSPASNLKYPGPAPQPAAQADMWYLLNSQSQILDPHYLMH